MSRLNRIHSPTLRVLSVVFFVGCGPGEATPDANSGSSSTMGGSAGDSTDEGTRGSTGGQSTGAGNGSDDVGSSGRATTHAGGSSTSAGATTAGPGTTGPGTTGSGTDDSGTGVGAAVGEIVCGEAVCDGPTEYCLACESGDTVDAHCEPQIGDPWQQAFEHGCSGVALFLECDTPEDCDGAFECVFSGGEAGYATCTPPQGNPQFGVACDDAYPCSRGWTCEIVDPLGYFGPYETVLGWLPRACVAP